MWKVDTQPVPSGIRMKVLCEDSQLSFREFFSLLRSNAEFAFWYGETLADCNLDAFFWEFPPLTTATVDHKAEFVVIESAALAALQPDPVPFESQFARQPDSDVITFPNLGGDALLIVPARLGSIETYPHLATFLRNAPKDQIRSLWTVAADAVHDNLSDSPRWLSTNGLGVSWLHLRLDTRPKYYNFSPYKCC
jgi:hypothetical protein